MKYITEFQPQLTESCLTFIANNLDPVFSNETNIYALDYVYGTLSDEIAKNENEEIFGISLADIKELGKLLREQVDYIEF